MVLLDKNVMTIEPKELLSTRTVVTIIGGEVVYQRAP
jgi:predicted amidohydrolase YtcJ